MNVGDKVEYNGFTYVVRAVKKSRVVLGDPNKERETIAVKPSALASEGGASAEPAAKQKTKKKRKATPSSRDQEVASSERAERNVMSGLDAVLIAETEDDGKTWVCPEMDVTMIASHLKLLHGINLQGLEMTEDEMLVHHQSLHDAPFSEPAIRHLHQEAA